MYKASFVFLLIAFFFVATVGIVYSTDSTRVTFSHQETRPWRGNRGSDIGTVEYTVDWDLSITGKVTFPVDISVYNSNQIDPNASDEVNCKVTAPENEGSVTVTVVGSIDVTREGLVPITGHKDVSETLSKSTTTPIDEKEIPLGEIPIGPIEIPPAPPVYVILKPTLNLSSSIIASASVEGPATVSPSNLEWLSDGDIEIIIVYSSSEAQKDDSINLTIRDVNYSWDSWIIVELYFSLTPSDGKYITESQPLRYQTHNILSDGDVEVPFNITVIPEFPPALILPIFIAVTLAVIMVKKRDKRSRFHRISAKL